MKIDGNCKVQVWKELTKLVVVGRGGGGWVGW